MKLLLNSCDLRSYMDGASYVKLGVGWFRHHPGHKWWGFTIEIYLLLKLISITFVSNYVEYDKRINYRKYVKK